ncbi:MAG TPA: hypothetical protein VFO60_02335 [Candidatus Dormibacteraeota bacterium]|nr:hypothetical protein [Candidatus Dormibacteraeota bacterium]
MRPTDDDHVDDRRTTFDAFARQERAEGAGGERERVRVRRGGPRAPIVLLPLIGLAAGIGIAYVAQSAHLTQAGYEESSLAATRTQLVQQDQQLADQIARLRAPTRVDAAAQRLGLKPPTKWTYVVAQPAPIAAPAGSAPPITANASDGLIENIVNALLAPASDPAASGVSASASRPATAGTAEAARP